jgi:hypothetical protein
MNTNLLVDYTQSGYLLHIVRDEVKVYASINMEMYCDDEELEFTGSYFIYLLHPKKGSCHFTLEYDHELGQWITRDAAAWVDNDIVLEIGESIKRKELDF